MSNRREVVDAYALWRTGFSGTIALCCFKTSVLQGCLLYGIHIHLRNVVFSPHVSVGGILGDDAAAREPASLELCIFKGMGLGVVE